MLQRRYPLVSVLVVLAGCGSDSTTAPTNPTNPTESVQVAVSRDTYVRSAAATRSYGTQSSLEVGGEYQTYLFFDLSDLPEEAIVSGAALTLTASSSNEATTVSVLECADDAWTESITYDDRPTAGSSLGVVAISEPITEDTPFSFSPAALTEFCKDDAIGGNRSVTLILTASNPVSFYSSNGNADRLRPQLEVTYTIGRFISLQPVADTTVIDGGEDPEGADETLKVDRATTRAFLRFDLGAIPSTAEIHDVRLSMVAYDGYAFGGDGKVYTMFVPDDSWNEGALLWSTQPDITDDDLGSWWLWYDNFDVDKWGRNRSASLRSRVKTEVAGDGVVSLRLHSPGYRTSYRSREYETEAKRPTLRVLISN